MDGKQFPSKFLDCLLAGLLRYMCEKNPFARNFLSESDPQYAGELGTLLRINYGEMELGHQYSILEKELLWSSGVMGVANPHALSNAVFLRMERICVFVVAVSTMNLSFVSLNLGMVI